MAWDVLSQGVLSGSHFSVLKQYKIIKYSSYKQSSMQGFFSLW